jgi:hypothetical protein
MISVALRKLLVTAGSAAILAAAHVGAANAGMLPTPSLAPGQFDNIGGELINLGHSTLDSSTFATPSGTSYASLWSSSGVGGGLFYYDYTFSLTTSSKVSAAFGYSGTPVTLGLTGPTNTVGVVSATQPPTPPAVTTVSLTTSTLSLFKDVGGVFTAVTPGASVLSGAHQSLSYADLASGEYILVVVGKLGAKGATILSGDISVSSVPVPGAMLLFGSGLAAMTWIGARRRNRAGT